MALWSAKWGFCLKERKKTHNAWLPSSSSNYSDRSIPSVHRLYSTHYSLSHFSINHGDTVILSVYLFSVFICDFFYRLLIREMFFLCSMWLGVSNGQHGSTYSVSGTGPYVRQSISALLYLYLCLMPVPVSSHSSQAFFHLCPGSYVGDAFIMERVREREHPHPPSTLASESLLISNPSTTCPKCYKLPLTWDGFVSHPISHRCVFDEGLPYWSSS